VKKGSKTSRCNQQYDVNKSSINNYLQSPIDQIFEPEHTLFNPNYLTNTMREDEFFKGNNDKLSEAEGEEKFFALPNTPTLTNVENNITDPGKKKRDDQSCETRFLTIFNPGTPNSQFTIFRS